MKPSVALLALVAFPSAVVAQSPVITPAGDPSVNSDTVYRLAVNPSAYPEEDWIYLLDDGVVRFEADGRSSKTYRYVAQVLKQRAVSTWAERTFSYDANRERLTINWTRVIGPDGQVISDKPQLDRESDAPVQSSAPVYSDVKLRRISLAGVATGTIVDVSWTTETINPALRGDFNADWNITTGFVTRRSRFIVDVPLAVTPRMLERNVPSPKRTATVGGRRIYTWLGSEIKKPEPEPFMSDSNNTVNQSVHVYGPVTWSRIATWYDSLSRDRYMLTPEVESAFAAAAAGARNVDDSLRAAHKWIAQDIRYVSLSLGIGGYRPRTPAEVVQSRSGDCKDKATLFIALARKMGVEAFPVLIRNAGRANRAFPSIRQFDHMIVAVRRGSSSDYIYVDLTSAYTPWGMIPPSLQGEFGLVVHQGGRAEEVFLPESAVAGNRTETLVSGTLTEEGLFSGRVIRKVTGDEQIGLRSRFGTPMTEEERSRFLRVLGPSLFENATADSLTVPVGKDLTAEPVFSYRVSNGKAASLAGNTMILKLPMPRHTSGSLIRALEADSSRQYWIDPDLHCDCVYRDEFRVTVPAGWQARLPRSVTAESRFGVYRAAYTQQGTELVVIREEVAVRNVEPPTAVGALIAWLKQVATDDTEYIVLEKRQ